MDELIKALSKEKGFKNLVLLIVLFHSLELQREVFKKKLRAVDKEADVDFQYADFLRNDSMIQKILDIYK